MTAPTTATPHFLDDTKDIPIPLPKWEGPPLVHWYNANDGRPPMFYSKLSHYDGAEPGNPWQDADFFEEAAIYFDASAGHLPVQVLGYRSQPYFLEMRNGQKRKQWLLEYTDGARVQTDVLCLMAGYDLPVIWSVTGMTGRHVTGKTESIFAAYRASLLAAASQAQRREMPMWTFELPIGVARDGKGKIKYVKTEDGGSYTPPDLFLPKGTVDEQMQALYVGRERYIIATELYRTFSDNGWFKFKRGQRQRQFSGTAPTGRSAEPVQPPAYVADQPPLDAYQDDIPF